MADKTRIFWYVTLESSSVTLLNATCLCHIAKHDCGTFWVDCDIGNISIITEYSIIHALCRIAKHENQILRCEFICRNTIHYTFYINGNKR